MAEDLRFSATDMIQHIGVTSVSEHSLINGRTKIIPISPWSQEPKEMSDANFLSFYRGGAFGRGPLHGPGRHNDSGTVLGRVRRGSPRKQCQPAGECRAA